MESLGQPLVVVDAAELCSDPAGVVAAWCAAMGLPFREQALTWEPGMRPEWERPHELRHTAASLAISAGATVKSVQRMLGHASATLTLDRYGHLSPDELDAVAARLDEAARQAGVYRMCTEADPMLVDEEVSDHEEAG